MRALSYDGFARQPGMVGMTKRMLWVCLLLGCAETQRPVSFGLKQPPTSLEAIAGALTSLGHNVAASNPQAGVVQTEWRDTGFGYGFINDVGATIVRRYVLTV